MMRSLYSGVAGLKTHQTKMDVIGNNIANVNTVGFKASNVTFSDVLYQTTQSSSGPNETTGTAGSNAKQIGLGSQVNSITTTMSVTGGTQTTNNAFDVMINGDSFFVVNSGGTNYFTKSGAFQVDANGNLCTAAGAYVMGWQVDPDNETKTKVDQVSALRIMSAENMKTTPAETTDAYVTGNIDAMDSQVIDSGRLVQVSFYDKKGNSYTAKFNIQQGTNVSNLYGVSVVDIVDSNDQSIFLDKVVDEDTSEVSYEMNDVYTVSFGGVEMTVSYEEGELKVEHDPLLLAFDASNGAFIGVGEGDPAADSSEVDATDLEKFLNLTIAADQGPFADNGIDIDFSTITMYAASGSSSLESYKGDLDGLGKGKQAGNMTGVSIDASGKIYGSYDNGDLKLLGQIAVAEFANPAGLESVGGSLFAQTQNSGEFNGVGVDPTSGGGSLTTGVLEMSNVDLSSEFTSMITTQRGFQASSRIITTSDTLLEELINLKR